jgi:DNA-binding transcriptional regulator YiaG
MKNWTPKEIKTLRAKHNLSQPAFGSLLGVTGNYIYLMEKGVKIPSKTLRLLLDYIERQLKENEKGKGG